VTSKTTFLSLAGTLTVVHFSLFLLVIILQRSLTGPDGTVHVTEENRPVVELLSMAMVVHMFPVGWLSFLTNWQHPSGTDIVLTVILAAANSALVGQVLAWIVRSVQSFRLRLGQS